MTTTATAAPTATIYGTPSCVQCKSALRIITERGGTPTYIDLTQDETGEAEQYIRNTSGGDLRLPFVVIQMANGEQVTFSGNRRDIIDQHFPRRTA